MAKKPVTIAVIADTHVNRMDELPTAVLDVLDRVDLIIHLGDFTSPQLLDDFKKRGNFHGIWGNHDRLPEMRKRLNRIEVLEVDGKRLGLIHGLFYPVGREKRLKAWFKNYKIDVLLFGHNHLVTCKIVDGILLFNPGTVTCQFPATQGSFGLLTLNGTITGKVIAVKHCSPMWKKYLILVPSLFIREGTRFLESWPYMDLSPLWSNAGIILKRLSLNFKNVLKILDNK
jgi:putative phosphoesterase